MTKKWKNINTVEINVQTSKINCRPLSKQQILFSTESLHEIQLKLKPSGYIKIKNNILFIKDGKGVLEFTSLIPGIFNIILNDVITNESSKVVFKIATKLEVYGTGEIALCTVNSKW